MYNAYHPYHPRQHCYKRMARKYASDEGLLGANRRIVDTQVNLIPSRSIELYVADTNQAMQTT